MAADFDRRIDLASGTLSRGEVPASDAPSVAADPNAPTAERLQEHMIRRPTEEDFADVLTPEGNITGDIAGADVTGGTGVSNASVAVGG